MSTGIDIPKMDLLALRQIGIHSLIQLLAVTSNHLHVLINKALTETQKDSFSDKHEHISTCHEWAGALMATRQICFEIEYAINIISSEDRDEFAQRDPTVDYTT